MDALLRAFLVAIGLQILCSALPAGQISLTGALNPEDANDVLLVSFVLSTNTPLTIQSYGYGGTSAAPGGTNAAGSVIAASGFDTYFSLFNGTGPGAVFLASNDDGPCPPAVPAPACRDSELDFASFAAGAYTLAVSVFDNFSFAENLGGGTLGDGFIGLGSYFNLDSASFRNSTYAIDITANGLTISGVTETSPVPEPATTIPLVIGLAIFRRLDRKERRK